MAINKDTLDGIIAGLGAMPKKSEIDTPTNNIDLLATETEDGLMSAEDKAKLNAIVDGANNYTHPTSSGYKHIPSGGSSGQILRWESDGTAKWSNETIYNPVSSNSNGLMTSSDKINLDAAVSKLAGIDEGANKYILPTASNSVLGGVKTTSSVTSTSGLTACPIIDGVPYYSNNSYNLPTASNTTLGGVTTTSNVTSTSGLTACPIIAGVPYYSNNVDTVDNVHLSCTDSAESGSHWFAAWTDNGNIKAINASRAYVGNAGNADKLGGVVDAYHLATYSASGAGHGADHQLYCQYNIYGDNRFGFKMTGGHEVRCDYATNASNASNATNASYATNAGKLGGVVDAYHLGVYASDGYAYGASYGTDFQLHCRHHIFGDGRYGLRVGDGTIGVRVDYATDADTVDGRHAYRIPTLDANANPWNTYAENVNDAYLQWDGATYFKLKTFGGNLTAVDYATNAGNADKLGNAVDAYHLATYSDGNTGNHGMYQLYCRYNKYFDGRFGFGITDEIMGIHEVRCDYATNTSNAANADTVDYKHASDFAPAVHTHPLRDDSVFTRDIFSTTLNTSSPCWNKNCRVWGQSTDPNGSEYIANAPESSTALWYEVSTIGADTRAYQIAYGCYTHQRSIFIRYKHDSAWSGWFKINTTAM